MGILPHNTSPVTCPLPTDTQSDSGNYEWKITVLSWNPGLSGAWQPSVATLSPLGFVWQIRFYSVELLGFYELICFLKASECQTGFLFSLQCKPSLYVCLGQGHVIKGIKQLSKEDLGTNCIQK